MATFAHFGDQTGNEKAIVERGYGIKLNKRNLFFNLERFTFLRPQFNSQCVTTTITTLLNDPKYRNALKIAQLQSFTTGGRKLAADTVEKTYISGYDHLIDRNLHSR